MNHMSGSQYAGSSSGHINHKTACAYCGLDFGVRFAGPHRVTKCGHKLHTECMNKWLPITKHCPVCQTSIPNWINTTNKCVVCLDILNSRDVTFTTGCSHTFHDDCLKQYLSAKQRCPICKKNIMYMHTVLEDYFCRLNESAASEEPSDADEFVDVYNLARERYGFHYEDVEREFDDNDYSSTPEGSDDDFDYELNCTICFERFEDSAMPKRRTKCGHLLHTQCMDEYLPQAKKCPVCKRRIKWFNVTNKCVVCLDVFKGAEAVSPLPCSHACHPQCLEQWSAVKKRCPICKCRISLAVVECAICLENVNGGGVISTLRCGHKFHRHCFDSWLDHDTTCPMCRIQV